MRRTPALLAPLLLLPLLLGLAPAAALAQTPTPAATATASPGTPAPTSGRDVGLADDGTTITVRPGEQVRVRLAAPASGGAWQGTVGLESGTPTMHLLQFASGRSEQLTAVLEALSPGRYGGSTQVRPQRLAAEEVFPCYAASPPCATAGRTWSVQVVVADGPTVTGPLACRTVGRPSASPMPGGTFVNADDDGSTVRVGRDGYVSVVLDSCGEPGAAPPRSTPPLFRERVRVDRTVGQVDALFRPQAAGTAQVSAAYDMRCLHRTDAAGDGECAVGQRAYAVTVQVDDATSAPSPCTKPVAEGFGATPERVAPGDPVELAGGRRDLCREESQESEKQFVLYARQGDGEELLAGSVRAPYFRQQVRPQVTTTYRLTMDGRDVGQPRTVVVDRTAGSCATALTLDGPARAVAGSTAVLSGRAAPGQTVRVLFRRYGETAFTVRRTLTADADGHVSTTWTVADDHRWYAATDRCDSPVGLTKAAPRITGPAVVRRGETVTLRVEAVSGVRTTVFFRGAGEPFSARRTLTGPGTVTYTATRDQRYYALTRHTVSNHGLTQVR